MAEHWGNWAALLPGWSAATSATVTQQQPLKPGQGLWCCNLAPAAPGNRLRASDPASRVWTRVVVCIGGIFRDFLKLISQGQERHCLSLYSCCRCYRVPAMPFFQPVPSSSPLSKKLPEMLPPPGSLPELSKVNASPCLHRLTQGFSNVFLQLSSKSGSMAGPCLLTQWSNFFDI